MREDGYRGGEGKKKKEKKNKVVPSFRRDRGVRSKNLWRGS